MFPFENINNTTCGSFWEQKLSLDDGNIQIETERCKTLNSTKKTLKNSELEILEEHSFKDDYVYDKYRVKQGNFSGQCIYSKNKNSRCNTLENDLISEDGKKTGTFFSKNIIEENMDSCLKQLKINRDKVTYVHAQLTVKTNDSYSRNETFTIEDSSGKKGYIMYENVDNNLIGGNITFFGYEKNDSITIFSNGQISTLIINNKVVKLDAKTCLIEFEKFLNINMPSYYHFMEDKPKAKEMSYLMNTLGAIKMENTEFIKECMY